MCSNTKHCCNTNSQIAEPWEKRSNSVTTDVQHLLTLVYVVLQRCDGWGESPAILLYFYFYYYYYYCHLEVYGVLMCLR